MKKLIVFQGSLMVRILVYSIICLVKKVIKVSLDHKTSTQV